MARAFAWQHLFAPLVSLAVSQVASCFAWLYSISAAAFARDAAAAKQRADDSAQLRALCNRIEEYFTVTTHQGR